jgi:hypothetical protein
MPARSSRQYGAMQAAAHGHSNLGIPAEVGREFVAKTPKKKRKRYAKEMMMRRRGLLSMS